MEEEKRISYKWVYATLVLFLAIGTAVMIRFGNMAINMPDAAKELNSLMDKKVKICSGDHSSKECAKAILTLKEFQRKWFASNKFKAKAQKPK